MYPNLYYVFKDWFGVEWKVLSFLNTFGFMVAVGFIVGAIVLTSELKRKEKLSLLLPREETITVGKPATFLDLLINFITGFLFGFKLIGVMLSKPDNVTPQEYVFSSQGNWVAGILLGLLLAGVKWREKNKQKAAKPEQRSIRIWPHDRVGDIVVIALVFGIIGAKVFDGLENWEDFKAHPMERLFSPGGLTFYGGLIVAAIAVCVYASKKNIKLIHLVDAAAPVLIITYAVGRIGCQLAGDGDWGIYNSAYTTAADGKVIEAKAGEYKAQLEKYSDYFLRAHPESKTLDQIPHKAVMAPAFLPDWMLAYNYPQNVNNDGIVLQGITDEHNRVLPIPVFPTPFYETIMCTLLFLVMWGIRKKLKIAGLMTGIYLVFNGTERFLIEHIRVNNITTFFGMQLTQAELISFSMIIAGFITIAIVLLRNKKA
ncbi:MAG TPA: prolipoprotein diacylglyceryl transferase [Ferruginibacter sp.]|nr:prolipoprotein diacylglyceryl transferase [Ferruginibacter sp.]HPH90902.1 prolipoprotein diacylglyceryl transferase [Ferruginibacter sp.]